MSRHKPCGKVIFRSRFAADRALRSIAANRRPGGFESRKYFCRPCNGWHLTSKL